MPDFIKTSQANGSNLAVVGINMNDDPAEVNKFIGQVKIPYSVVIDNTGDLTFKYRVRGHPTSIFINKTGVITGMVNGLATPEVLAQELSKALG